MSASDPRNEPLNWTYPTPPPGGGTGLLRESQESGEAPPQSLPSPPSPPSPAPPWSSGAPYTSYDARSYQAAAYDAPAYDSPAHDAPPPGSSSYNIPPYQPAPPQPPRPPWGRRVAAAGVLVAVAVGSGVTGALVAGNDTTKTVVAAAAPVKVSGSGAPTETLAKVAAAVSPSVVSITVRTGAGGDTGSGVILRSDGTIVTNNHVVAAAADGAGTISVKFADGSTASASIVGRDPATDLAVIKASGVSGKTPATLGSTAGVHVGDAVLAIGSPLGLDGSVSSGIVSALHRTVELGSESGAGTGASVGDAIQTDAAINPGNSGGPLVDDQGRVIGINSAIASLGGGDGRGQSGSIGVGFAIPSDEVSSVANQLIKGETPRHALLGIGLSDDPNGGALITDVAAGSSAARGGLRAGDVITKVDQTATPDASSLAAVIRAHQPADKVTVQYQRDGVAHTAVIALGSATG
jgi:putative serine protease PepD